MSNHHGKEFLGFGTTTPAYILPERSTSACSSPRCRSMSTASPVRLPTGCGRSRRRCIDAGYDARIVHPSHLDRYMPGAGEGPAGLRPRLLRPQPAQLDVRRGDAQGAAQLVSTSSGCSPSRTSSRRASAGMKIIAGGPCAWQLSPADADEAPLDPGVRRLHRRHRHASSRARADLFVRDIVGKALRDEFLPPHVVLGAKEAPKVEQISSIKFPSVNGLIEIGRGCCRGCSFCSVTTRPTRWYPLEKIEEELEGQRASRRSARDSSTPTTSTSTAARTSCRTRRSSSRSSSSPSATTTRSAGATSPSRAS